MLHKWNNKANLFTRFTEYFKFSLKNSVKKNPSHISLTAHFQGTWLLKSSKEMYNEIKVVFIPANTLSIFQPIDQF